MIVFATAITDLDMYQSYAEPGIRLAGEPDSEVMPSSASARCFAATT